MPVELKVPAVGESITEVQIAQWLKREGDVVEKDENLVEIETDKATVELPAPVSGRIAKVLKQNGETAAVGEVIGYMEEVAAGTSPASTRPSDADAAAAAATQAAQTIRTPGKSKEKAGAAVRPAERGGDGAERHGKRSGGSARRPATEPRVDRPHGAPASAEEEQRNLVVSDEVPRPLPHDQEPQPAGPETLPIPLGSITQAAREEEVVPMSPIRRRIAQRLVEAQHSAALLTTFNEVDMSAVIALRHEHKTSFQDKFGIKLGFMSFFVKASIDALKLVPQVNAYIRGNDIIYHNYFDIGIAVGGGKGLVVPILRDADRMSFAEIEIAIADLAARARDNKLALEELQGGTFTISNGGVYGSLLSTPIVNPPQSGILGLHAIEDRPVAREGQVVIRPMMYLALTYDHRIVDGAGAVTFLKRVKDVIEEPLRMLVEV